MLIFYFFLFYFLKEPEYIYFSCGQTPFVFYCYFFVCNSEGFWFKKNGSLEELFGQSLSLHPQLPLIWTWTITKYIKRVSPGNILTNIWHLRIGMQHLICTERWAADLDLAKRMKEYFRIFKTAFRKKGNRTAKKETSAHFMPSPPSLTLYTLYALEFCLLNGSWPFLSFFTKQYHTLI